MKGGAVSLALFILLCTPIAWAYEEFVAFDGEVVQAWVAVVDNNSVNIVRADREKVEGGYTVKADMATLSDRALVSAVIMDSEGGVTSTPLHNRHNNELEQQSVRLAQMRIPALELELKEARAKLQLLKGEMKLGNIRTRKELGFDDVDLIYERISAIQDQIKAIKKSTDQADTIEGRVIDIKQ